MCKHHMKQELFAPTMLEIKKTLQDLGIKGASVLEYLIPLRSLKKSTFFQKSRIFKMSQVIYFKLKTSSLLTFEI